MDGMKWGGGPSKGIASQERKSMLGFPSLMTASSPKKSIKGWMRRHVVEGGWLLFNDI